MSIYIRTRGGNSLAIAICDRCKFKFRYDDLRADGNSPGLRVCQKCYDVKDPWRLPARQTETVNLRQPRPDESVAIPEE